MKPKLRNDKDSIPEFQIPGVGGVKSKDSSSEESRNRETRSREMSQTSSVLEFRAPQHGESRNFTTGILKCRFAEMRNAGVPDH
jgi:hypothetical protein